MEAQLIDTAVRPRPAPVQRPANLQAELLVRIDRYLRAAGAADSRLRSRLIAATAQRLLAHGNTYTWAEVIAAVDRSLATEFSFDDPAVPPPGVAGRIALHHLVRDGAASYGESLPPCRRLPMPPQPLQAWHPNVGWLGRLKPQPPSPGLAASLCSLVAFFIP